MTPYASRRFRQHDDEDEQSEFEPVRDRYQADAGFGRWAERVAALQAGGFTRPRSCEYDDEDGLSGP
ncbi:MAG: hypothetical protein ACREL5_14470 [Gemmatimonadales bacterium]